MNEFSAGKVGMPVAHGKFTPEKIDIPTGRDPLKMGHSVASISPPTEREMSLTALTVMTRNTRRNETNDRTVIDFVRRGIDRCVAAGNQSFMIYQHMVKGGLDMSFEEFACISRLGGSAPSPTPVDAPLAQSPAIPPQEKTDMTSNPEKLSLDDVRAHLQKCIDAGEKPSTDTFCRSGIAYLLGNGVSRVDILREVTDRVTPPISSKVANGILTSVFRHHMGIKSQDPIKPVTDNTADTVIEPIAADREAGMVDPTVEAIMTAIDEPETVAEIEEALTMTALTKDERDLAHESVDASITDLIDAQLRNMSSAELLLNWAKADVLRLSELLATKAEPIRSDDSRVVLLTAFAQNEFTDPRIREALTSILAEVVDEVVDGDAKNKPLRITDKSWQEWVTGHITLQPGRNLADRCYLKIVEGKAQLVVDPLFEVIAGTRARESLLKQLGQWVDTSDLEIVIGSID